MILTVQVIANLLFIAIGIAYAMLALRLPAAAFGNPNAPKIYPLIIAAGMILISLWLLVKELAKQKAGKSTAKATFKLTTEGKLVAFVSVLCVLYAIAFEKLGYIISSVIFIEALMLYISKGKKMITATVVAVCFPVVIYVLFSKVLSISLPPTPFLDF